MIQKTNYIGILIMSDAVDKLLNTELPVFNFSNPIYDLINEKFYKKRFLVDSGLFLSLPFPTGIGKTYNTLSLLFQFLIDEARRKSTEDDYTPKICYFITHSVDNVFEAYCDLQFRISNNNELTDSQKSFFLSQLMYAPSNSSTLLNIIREYRTQFDEIIELFQIKQHKILWQEIDQLIKHNDSLKEMSGDKGFIEKVLEDKAVNIYSKLVSHIQAIQRSDEDAKPLYRHKEILSLLIPGILLEESIAQTRIVFMTTKKFLHGLQQSKGKFYPTKNLEGQMLIIDEIDRQQQEILDHLVKSNEIDILGTLCTIHSNLNSQKLSAAPEYKGISDIFETYLEKIIKVFNENELQYSFNLHESLKSTHQKRDVLLFSDKLATHISSYRDRLVFIKNKETLQHEIGIKGGLGDTEREFPKFAGLLEKLVNQDFFTMIHQAEELYRKNVKENNIFEKSTRTSSEIISAILKQFNLYDLRGWLKNQLNFLSGRQYSKRNISGNYHTRGLRVIEVAYPEDVHDSVIFKYHGYDSSPTGMLASWVEAGANILGISATAECESVIHNFHMSYLKNSLGDRYITLSAEDRKTVQDYYDQERNYEKAGIQLTVESFSENLAFIKPLIKEYAYPLKNEPEIYRQLFFLKKGESYDYKLKELSKICFAIKTFIESDNNRYMMLMLTAHRHFNKERDKTNNKSEGEFLYWYIKKLANLNKIPVEAVFGMNAQKLKIGDFQNNVIDHLATSPGKLIVFTAYETMSSGKNPDYTFDPALENNSLAQVGTHQTNKTDIDTIYLQHPTNLISVNDQDNKMTNQLRLMSYGLALQEANFNSPAEIRNWCDQILTSGNLNITCNILKKQFYNLKSPSNYSQDALSAVYRIIEQSLGRSARTGMKRHNIFLFLDHDLVPLLAEDYRQSAILTHEYRAVRDYAKKEMNHIKPKSQELRKLHNLALKNSARSWQKIENRLIAVNNNPNKDSIRRWHELRDIALKSPAVIDAPLFEELYLYSSDASGYSFTKPENENNFRQYTFFDLNHESSKKYKVSEEESRLPILMQNDVIKKTFEAKQYCTEWPSDAHHLLTPPMFINIYLGALGEIGGSAILKSNGCTIEELPHKLYEKFDGLLHFKKHEALIDFKHWNLSSWNFQSEDMQRIKMAKIIEKLKLFPNQRLIICNLVAQNDNNEIRFYDENFNEIDEEQSTIIEVPRLLKSTGESDLQNILKLLSWMQMR